MRDWPLDLRVGTGIHSLGLYLPIFILVLAYSLYKLRQRRHEYEVSL